MCREAENHDKLFLSTRWATILKAGDSAASSVQALSALSELCQIYWRPLYVFLRKKGYAREDAQDQVAVAKPSKRGVKRGSDRPCRESPIPKR
jgi:hypothetical protein